MFKVKINIEVSFVLLILILACFLKTVNPINWIEHEF